MVIRSIDFVTFQMNGDTCSHINDFFLTQFEIEFFIKCFFISNKLMQHIKRYALFCKCCVSFASGRPPWFVVNIFKHLVEKHWVDGSHISYGAYVGRRNESSSGCDLMAKLAVMPVYGKNL